MTIFLLIIITALSFTLGTTMTSKAQDKNFSGVLPFVSNNRVGFFDQGTGRVYIYDSAVSSCVFVGQIESLGQAISVVSSNPSSSLD